MGEKARNRTTIAALLLVIFFAFPEHTRAQQSITLAGNLHNPQALAVDQSNVYWIETSIVPPSSINVVVRRVPIGGGTPTDIATQTFGTNVGVSVDVDSTSVYWSISPGGGSGFLYKAPITGGTPTLLTTANQPTTIAVDGTYVYWVETNGGGFTGVRKIPVNGGPADVITLTSDNSFIYTALDIDDTYVYFGYLSTAQPFPFNTKYIIAKVPKGGGSIINLAPFTDGALASLVVDNSFVYWVASDTGTVQKVSKNGGAATLLANGLNQPMRVAVDATDVYWTEFAGGTAGAGSVRSVPVAGGALTTLASALNSPSGIVADGTTVYWTELGTNGNNGAIKKVGTVVSSSLLTLPFSVGDTWYVCQGYNGQISHQGAAALDLSIDPMSPGHTGCGSGPDASTTKPVLAPAAGIVEDHIKNNGDNDMLCLRLDRIAIMKIGHLTNMLPIGTRFKQNDMLGTVEGPSKGNGDYAHIHLQIQDLSDDCKKATTIPFSGLYRFEEAPDMPYDDNGTPKKDKDDPTNQWSGTVLHRSR